MTALLNRFQPVTDPSYADYDLFLEMDADDDRFSDYDPSAQEDFVDEPSDFVDEPHAIPESQIPVSQRGAVYGKYGGGIRIYMSHRAKMMVAREALEKGMKRASYTPVVKEVEGGEVDGEKWTFRVQSEMQPNLTYTIRFLPNGMVGCNCQSKATCKHPAEVVRWLKAQGRELPDPASLFPPENDEPATEPDSGFNGRDREDAYPPRDDEYPPNTGRAFAETPEGKRSGPPSLPPATIADWIAFEESFHNGFRRSCFRSCGSRS